MPCTARVKFSWFIGLLAALPVWCCGDEAVSEPAPTKRVAEALSEPVVKQEKRLFQGKVVRVTESLKRRGIKAYPEDLKNQVALETEAGELIPILPDWRGRAFFQDERLQNREIELVGFRHTGLPYLSVLSVYTFDEKGQRQFTDYWCDICSIPMYEIKPCDCCQQDIRLRFQPQELPDYLDPANSSKPKSPLNSGPQN